MLIIQFAIGIVVNLYVTVPAADRAAASCGARQGLSNRPAALAVARGPRPADRPRRARAGRPLGARPARTDDRAVRSVGLLAILAAVVNGIRFVADGGPANASLAMALSTAVAMLCYAISLFVLGRSQPATC